ncbi:hypothetical protein Pcinc_023934 [Petrolisthes cinctipes]|uniref:Uncharacterized protein n=1 Tax=Petrolisthes cinctipes TaxID=88211 RepID=A0AAE1KF60_PETCI|nr:hypothetical protein Pcinc_023934 [Petrolisthes cinctipes]
MDWQLQLFADWDDQERLDAEINALAGARRRPRRIVTDRMNPFTSMSDDEFVDRFRLRKVSAVTLLEEVRNELPAAADLRVIMGSSSIIDSSISRSSWDIGLTLAAVSIMVPSMLRRKYED